MEHRGTEEERSEREEINRLTYAIIGAAIAVHRALGPGFLEAVYEQALSIELGHRGLRFDRQQRIPISYKGEVVGEHIVDLVVEGRIIVELKAIERLAAVHHAQVLSYLKAAELDFGLLINFNVSALKNGVRRILAKGAEGAT
jgi:GxxExxY protein